MEQIPFLSIVMPVYRVEKHLEKAVNSILNQDFNDWELILVDDCSPDTSGQIADRLAEGNERIQVIHLPRNEGLSCARNAGLVQARGQYIFFMDSDDTVDSTLLSEIFRASQDNHPQVIVWGLIEEYYNESGKLSYTKAVDFPHTVCTNREQVRSTVFQLESRTLFGYAWNKAYDLSYLRQTGLQFETVTLIEDILFNVKLIRDVERMTVLPVTPYHYQKRIDNSLTNKFVPEYYELHRRRVQMIYDLYEFWGTLDDQVRSALAAIYARYIFSALQRNCDPRAQMAHRDRRVWVRALFADPLFQALAPYMSRSGGLLKILGICLAARSAALCLLFGRFIYLVKTKMPLLFARAKQKR